MTAQLSQPYPGVAPALAVPQVNPTKPPVLAVAITDGEGTMNPTMASGPPNAQSLYTEAPTARTATGATAGMAFPAGVNGIFVGLNVTAVSGTTPQLFINFQQQDANGVWQTVANTSAMTGTGTMVLDIGPGTNNGIVLPVGVGQWRIQWVISGTTPSFTFQVGVTAR